MLLATIRHQLTLAAICAVIMSMLIPITALAQRATPDISKPVCQQTGTNSFSCYSEIWAGYLATSSTKQNPRTEYREVHASWHVPTVDCSLFTGLPPKVAFWVGLGGLNAQLEQIGTITVCNLVGGGATYQGVYEMIDSSGKRQIKYLSTKDYPINPGNGGDSISASVTYQNNGKYELKLSNYTKAWVFSTIAKAKGSEKLAARSSAECITEDPPDKNGGRSFPLAKFGLVTFDGCSSGRMGIGSVGPLTITFVMTNNGQPEPDGTAMAKPGVLQHGDQFDVIWYSGG